MRAKEDEMMKDAYLDQICKERTAAIATAADGDDDLAWDPIQDCVC
jgi:hypothetical protein